MEIPFSVTNQLNIRIISPLRLSSDDNILCDFSKKGTYLLKAATVISQARAKPYPQRFRDEQQVGQRHPL